MSHSEVRSPWLSRRRSWLFGWRWPAGSDWLWLGPLVILAAVPSRAWAPQEATLDANYLAAAALAIALCAVATESWFRGVVHSLFVLDRSGRNAVREIVELGRVSARSAEVLAGLDEGDRVIVSDMSRWERFDRVEID